ncbi:MAG: HAD-IC family P-type ATPase, partial [Myxococcales bacterium]|nr:HAD-IC family P-type ATPase [Myxococcales bacterium]
MTELQRPVAEWHRLDSAEALERLESDAESGLSDAEAARRLAEAGPNALADARRRSLAAMVIGQFADFMILVLVGAAVVSGVVGEPADTIAILVILVLNAGIGAAQEYRAQRAMAALGRLAAPEARVVRDASVRSVPARELVPGDLVVLEAGNLVPADLRLLEAVELQTDESLLTGESHAVEKAVARLEQPELPLGDRCNLGFKGTTVTRGRGTGLVVATGMETEIGSIARLLAGETGVQTPLQQRLARFGRYLAIAVLAICGIVFVSGLLQGQPPVLMFLTAVSLAVAAIPEALPAVITVSLALGARKLSRRRSLVRNLPAVETLGSVTFICSDKTGTLTQNRMSLEALVVAGERYDRPAAVVSEPAWESLMRALALSNDVTEQNGKAIGDPTEVALHRFAEESGFRKSALEPQHPRLAEIPFESARQRMTTIHRDGDAVVAWVKGSPESLVPRCRDALAASGRGTLDPGAVLEQARALADEGYRVLALAERRFAEVPEPVDAAETDLTLVGLVGLIDPPRPEAPGAVAECLSAGITPVMITGDHPGTALAIAARLGIAEDPAALITGPDLAALSDDELAGRVEDLRIYARVDAE